MEAEVAAEDMRYGHGEAQHAHHMKIRAEAQKGGRWDLCDVLGADSVSSGMWWG